MNGAADNLPCLDDYEDRSERPRYSVSSLMAYEACPHQYYETFVRGKPPPIRPGMRRGTNLHGLIARHLRQPALIPGYLAPDVRELFGTFLDSRFNVPPVAVEEAFVLPFSSADVSGRIDVVLPGKSGGLEIVDFKSGSSRSRDKLEESLQLPLYAMAAGNRHDVPPEMLAWTYFFLRDGAEVRFDPQSDTFQQVTDRVERIVHSIHEGRFEARPGCRCYACRGDFGRRSRR